MNEQHPLALKHRIHGALSEWIHSEKGPIWWRGAAGVLSRLYGAGMAHRRSCLMKKSHRVPVPVVSVGNLTVGGTGKTPLVEWLIDHYQRKGRRSAVAMRGYGARDESGLNDEARMIKSHFPNVAVFSGANRIRSIENALATGCVFDVVLLDDGFQQWAMHRDWEIVVVTAPSLLLSGRLLPAGPFREPWTALQRAHTIVVTHLNQTPLNRLEAEQRLRPWTQAPVVFGRHVLTQFDCLNADCVIPWEALQQEPCAVVTAIGRPQAFVHALKEKNIKVDCLYRFPDHHVFRDDELERIERALLKRGVRQILVTEKDAVKLRRRSATASMMYACARMQWRWSDAQDEAIMRRGADAVVDA